MRFNITKLATAAALTLVTTFSAFAQTTYDRRPAQHNAEHKDLLAYQTNINEQIKLKETLDYMDNIFSEEEEPEEDIYVEGWDSQAVNCYTNAVVPDTKVIDVSNFCMPTMSYVTSPYGYRRRFRRMHKGIDLKVQIGDTIRAAFDGKVRLTRNQGRRKGYGLYVIVRHSNGLETVYGHLSKFLVSPDQYVKAGDPIALGGNTGRSTGPHLHFETRYMGYAINPAAIFDFENKTTHTDEFTFNKSSYKDARDYSPAKKRKTSSKALASSKSKAATVKVRKGDSLSKIAKANGTTVDKLCRLNGINRNTTLSVGKSLKVR
ncbi:LysM peptidoglycan-binding domain-containing protein [bacterium J10(2018)]|nr:LysM peptidoglycan-binding domain-containing protein [bacterium J10(2018)]